jgi:transcriptional regulator with XRE-family HTH domain
MPRRKPESAQPAWTPNQVVAGNLVRLRQRRGLTQAEVARLLTSVAGKEWSEAMVAHAERSVTGNRVREFTADDLVTLARAFDVPVLYFLTPPPKGIFVHVPGSRIDTITMLDAVLGRPDNLSEWETLLDEWNFAEDEELPFPLSQTRRQQIRAVAGEVALIRAHHLIRKHFSGNLMELRDTLRSLAELVLDVDKHEALAELDEDEQIRQIEAMRADIAKGNRIAEAGERFFEESVAEWEKSQHNPAGGRANRKRSKSDEGTEF